MNLEFHDDDFGRFPAFDLESYLQEQGIEFKAHESDGHIEIAFNCPKCTERGESRSDTKRRLWINKMDGKFTCYNCSWSGDLRRLVAHYSNTSYEGALKILRGNVLDSLEHLNFRLYDEPIDLKDESEATFREIDFPFGFRTFEERTPQIFTDYLEKRGVDLDYAISNMWGWSRNGFTKDRIVVPTFMDDLLVFWQARDVLGASHERWGTPEYKKVLNPSGISARSVLYNFDSARHYDEIRLCEGFMDAVKAGPSAVATNGKNLHELQVEWLTKTTASRVVILWDNDAYTDQKKNKLCSADRAVSLLKNFFEVRCVMMPNGSDCGAMTAEEIDALIEESP